MRKNILIPVSVLFLMTSVFCGHTPVMAREVSPIPHIVHYVWLGGKPLPETIQKAINSWRRYLPDWEIKQWNESNCDLSANAFVSEAYAAKRWNYASDWCRLVAMEKEGGVYFDTDMFLNAPLEPLLVEPAVLAEERAGELSGGIFAFVPHHPYVKELMSYYQNLPHFQDDTIPVVMNNHFAALDKSGRIFAGRKEGEYVLYPPNILMLNIGGPENVAEHWYANNDPNYTGRGSYFNFFSMRYFRDYAYRLNDFLGKDQHGWVVFGNGSDCYFSRGWSDNGNDPDIKLGTCLKEETRLLFTPNGGETLRFACHHRRCDLTETGNPKDPKSFLTK